QIDEHVAARFCDSGIHQLILNLSVSLPCNLNVFKSRSPRLFLKCVQNKHCVCELSNINYAPFPQHMNSDLSCAGTDIVHRLPVRWFKAALHRVQLESSLSSSLGGKVTEVIETRSNEP